MSVDKDMNAMSVKDIARRQMQSRINKSAMASALVSSVIAAIAGARSGAASAA